MSYEKVPRVLLVTLVFATKVKTKELEQVFNRGLDWVRYAPNCWLLRTKQTPSVWAARLQPQLDDDDRFFIVEVDLSERQGKLPKWIWEWIRKYTEAE